MKHVIGKGKTLIVDGPASMIFLSGSVRVLGAELSVGEKVVIREGKRIAFESGNEATVDLMLGEGASFEEIEGSTVPPSWEEASKTIISYGKPVIVMIIGGIDSGKTSFCTFLSNVALMEGCNVAVIDADVGQSDIGPPSTIGLGYVTKPIKDLFDLEANNLYFVGSTSPNGAIDRVVEGITTLVKRALDSGINFLIINTDGWTEGEDAKAYKVLLVQRVAPTVVVGMQQQNELKSILDELKDTKVLEAASPVAIKRRDREKRKILREMGYKKYLSKAKVRSFPLSWVKVEGARFKPSFSPPRNRVETISEILGAHPLYWVETPEAFFIILKEGQRTSWDGMNRIEEALGKKAKLIRQGEEEGLLVALQNDHEGFLGIGILCGIDYERRIMKVYTSAKENVSTVCIGQVKLDKMGREIGLSYVFTDCCS